MVYFTKFKVYDIKKSGEMWGIVGENAYLCTQSYT